MKTRTKLVVLSVIINLSSCSTTSTQNDVVTSSSEPEAEICQTENTLLYIPPLKELYTASPSKELYNPVSLQAFIAKATDKQERQAVEETGTDLWYRIRKGYGLPSVDNERVQRFVEQFTNNPSYLEEVSVRAKPYLYHIVQEADVRSIPLELTLLPVIESAYKPTARSHKSAAGLWQFMPATGRNFGLEQNFWYDGRRDVIASTDAALEYLQKLYQDFNGDWLKAIAAYNYGEGNLQKAVNRNLNRGDPTDFWSLDLPRETREFVPKLLAVAKIIANPQQYGINLASIADTPYIEHIDVGKQIDLSVAAQLAGLSSEEFKRLNPAFHREVTAPQGPHCILVPVDKALKFKQQVAQLSNQDLLPSSTDFSPAREEIQQPQFIPTSFETTQQPKSREMTATLAYHQKPVEDSAKPEVVARPLPRESHEMTAALAYRQKPVEDSVKPEVVARSPLPRESRETTALAYRQKPVEDSAKPEVVARSPLPRESRETTALAYRQKPVEDSAKPEMVARSLPHDVKEHRVNKGDTLLSLAKQYGTTIAELRRLNQLKNDHLWAGQKLTVPVIESQKVRLTYSAPEIATQEHLVAGSDTLWRIAKRYDTTVAELRRLNRLEGNPIKVGQKLKVPTVAAPPKESQIKSAPVVQHRVSTDDTLWRIAKHYGTTVDVLSQVNDLNGKSIKVGQVIKIPVIVSASIEQPATKKKVVYTVKVGDSLWSIARNYQIDVDTLSQWNGLTRNSALRKGQKLSIWLDS